MTLPELLVQDLFQWMDAPSDGVPRRILLWLDPEKQFTRMAPYLEPILRPRNVQLLCYGDANPAGQLSLKLTLLRLEAEPGERAIVYLPGFGQDALEPRAGGKPPLLWSPYDYLFKGCIWGREERWEPGVIPEVPTLYSWLRRRGLKVADDKTRRVLIKGGSDSLLARYAERQRESAPADWPQPLRIEDVETALAGDPRDALRGLLAAPTNEMKRWGGEKVTVLGRIRSEFGMLSLSDDLAAEELADEACVSLALTEAWEAFARPHDFPYLSRLPERAEQRARQVAFLRDDVLSHAELGPWFRARMRRLEPQYPLSDWGRDRAGQPAGLPRLAGARWQKFLDTLQVVASEGWKPARAFLVNEREAIRDAASAPWARFDEGTHWKTAWELTELMHVAVEVLDESEGLTQPAELVKRYAESWWRLDRLHRRVRQGADEAHLQTVRTLADQSYFDCVARLADQLCGFLEQDATWPPRGTTGVAALHASLWENGTGRQAILITDACRWDVAQELGARLEGEDCSLEPIVTTLPSNTPFGMAALLPLGDEPLTVDLDDGKPALRQGGPKTLETRDGRKAFLRARIVNAAGTPQVDFMDLEELLRGGTVPDTPLVVVLDNGLDEQGHKGPEQLPGLIDTFTRDLRYGIERLHASGFGTVHVVTDHGFLLLSPHLVDALGRPELPPAQTRYKHERWAVLKPDAPVTEVLRLPAPLAPDVVLGIPRGVRTLEKAQPYLHGGISLQECVIPHLVSRRVLTRERLGLDLQVSSDRLVGGTVPAIVRPAMAPGQASLGGYEPISVRLWVETSDHARTVAGPIELELRADVEELRPPLYLQEGIDLRAGTALRLRARDAETGQDLGSKDLTLLVDWE